MNHDNNPPQTLVFANPCGQDIEPTDPQPQLISDEMIMYIMINKNLSMGKGKIVSQTAHAVHHIVHQIIENYISIPESPTEDQSITEAKADYAKYVNWCTSGRKTVALNVPYEEMIKYTDNDKYKHKAIRDAGKTQVDPGSLTVIGFYPTNDLKAEMKKFKLL